MARFGVDNPELRMSPPRTLILVHRNGVQDQLVALLERLPWVPSRGLQFATIAGDVQQAVAERRDRERGLAIGFIAEDEPSVLAAIEGGADDAMVMPVPDAQSFAALVDRVELRARLRAETHRLHETFAHAEKLTALGTLVAGIGHEINNPLSAMMLSIEAARRYVLPALEVTWELARKAGQGEPVPDGVAARLRPLLTLERAGRDAPQLFEEIGSAAESIASIVRDLRVFARTDHDEPPELVDIEDLVDQALRLVGRELFQRALLERDYEPGLPKLVLPRNRVTQVIMNVLINAAHAIREIERPVHRIRVSARADEDFVAVAISDTGPGIPPEALSRIFDPFYTTKREEMGTGLGLAISRSILQRIGGDLSVESVYGDGATFLCFLPIPTREIVRDAHQRVSRQRPSERPRSGGTVLVVDDDERVLRSYVRLLNQSHRVMIAEDGRDAVELLESGSAPDLIVLELELPELSGRELLSWLEAHRPQLRERALIVTSVGSHPAYADFLERHVGPVLHKPVRGDDLMRAISELMAQPAASPKGPQG